VISFWSSSKTTKSLRLPIVDGMVPRIKLFERTNSSRRYIDPSDAGIDPLRLLKERSIFMTSQPSSQSPFSQVIPPQSQKPSNPFAVVSPVNQTAVPCVCNLRPLDAAKSDQLQPPISTYISNKALQVVLRLNVSQ